MSRRTSPGFSGEISGVCRGAMPTSPMIAGAYTICASPEKISSSALTISTWMVLAISLPYRSFAFSATSSIPPTM